MKRYKVIQVGYGTRLEKYRYSCSNERYIKVLDRSNGEWYIFASGLDLGYAFNDLSKYINIE